MSQASPLGAYLKTAEAFRARIEADNGTAELQSAEIMHDHGVSRGFALRAFLALQERGAAELVPGGRCRAVQHGEHADRSPWPNAWLP